LTEKRPRLYTSYEYVENDQSIIEKSLFDDISNFMNISHRRIIHYFNKSGEKENEILELK